MSKVFMKMFEREGGRYILRSPTKSKRGCAQYTVVRPPQSPMKLKITGPLITPTHGEIWLWYVRVSTIGTFQIL